MSKSQTEKTLEIKDEYIRVKITPNSSQNEITELLENEDGKTLKIRIKAKAEKNEANIELIKYLSKICNIPSENIKIISGRTERTKLIKFIK